MGDHDALRDTARVLLVLAGWFAAVGDRCAVANLVDRAADLLTAAGNGMAEEAAATLPA